MRNANALWLIKETFKNWSDDGASRMAAALAFYAAFAMAPLIIIVIEVGAVLLGGNGHHHVVRDEVLRNLHPSLGDAGTKAVGDLVQTTFDERQHGGVASILGWGIFIAAATGFFVSVEGTLNSVWHVERPSAGILASIRGRAKTLCIIAGIALVIMGSLAANGLIAAFAHAHPEFGVLAATAAAVVSFVIVSAAFAALFKFLPRTAIAWNDVLVGAVMTAALFLAGQYLIGLYLARVSAGSAFGAAGTFVAILTWLYYSGQIFLFGAEFTKVYASAHGTREHLT